MSQINSEENEITYAKLLCSKGYLTGRISKIFNIKKVSQYKINSMSFRCANYLCRKKYIITFNTIFIKYSSHKLRTISKIIKCFFCHNFNVKKAFNY